MTAIDTSSRLLNELATRDQANRIECIECDMRLIANQVSDPVELAICMGDTLTHLNHLTEVDDLIRDIGQWLNKNGSIVLSWRNLTEIPKGVGRFIPVNNSEDRIMTCFLEDAGDKVIVHDLIHVRNGSNWDQKCSAYEKIKVSSADVRSILEAHGFSITSDITENGMITLAAKKVA